jgi:hypothetical protein
VAAQGHVRVAPAAPTLFSFGYWGWGNAVPQLVAATDAVETARGFRPPLFVDIRISRSVRAKGFDGNAFAGVVGEHRYRWLDALGNVGILDGGAMRIKDPSAAGALVDIAVEASGDRRRLLFFCACEKPCGCHRSTVAKLVIDAASRRRQPVKIVEWPGGDPRTDLSYALSRAEFDKVRRGAASVPLGARMALSDSAAVPWYSLLRVRPDDADEMPTWRVVTGPAKFRKSGWYLPVHGVLDGEPLDAMLAQARRAREADGYSLRTS